MPAGRISRPSPKFSGCLDNQSKMNCYNFHPSDRAKICILVIIIFLAFIYGFVIQGSGSYDGYIRVHRSGLCTKSTTSQRINERINERKNDPSLYRRNYENSAPYGGPLLVPQFLS